MVQPRKVIWALLDDFLLLIVWGTILWCLGYLTIMGFVYARLHWLGDWYEEIMMRPCSQELDRLIEDKVKFPVLLKGFIRVVDYMGTDESIVQAARISYGKGTKSRSKDEALIRYLMRNRHTSPFEMCSIKLHVKVPMDIWRQWIRHRTAKVNEYSTRYSEAIDDTHETKPELWRLQSTSNKQGSEELYLPVGGDIETEGTGARLSAEEKWLHDESKRIYQERLLCGVAREQARKDLPLSTYTEAYWKIDLHNLLHFISLRWNDHAQFEIRLYADIIVGIVRMWVPMTWGAFLDYRMCAMSLSRQEIRIIQGDPKAKPLEGRELREFEAKKKELGL